MFISYRRDDASGFAGRLHESLSRHFGDERIFRDIDNIRPGASFPDAIQESLGSCGALLVVIGRGWLVDSRGQRRLEDPLDWVRQEVVAALARDDVLVFPVLVDGAAMPSAGDLPEPLLALAHRNAIEVSDGRWRYDISRLVAELDAVVGGPGRPGRLRRWVRPRNRSGALARLAALVALVAAVVTTGVVAAHRVPRPVPMRAQFNIAVADFSGAGPGGRPASSTEAHNLAQSVYARLDEQLAAIRKDRFDLELREPTRTGPVEGSTPEGRAASAGKLARRINADIVIYGTLELGVPSRFTTEFFLSDRQLEGAPELVGQHELGSAVRAPGDATRNAVASKDLRDQVLERTRTLAEFVIGLNYYTSDQPRPAVEHFEAARASPGWDDHAGKEVLYLFLGNATGKLGDFDLADGYYDQAISLNPRYARARLGKAEIAYQRARGDCEAGKADASGLLRSLELFQAALGAQAQTAASDIDTKVAFGSGRIYVCLSQALVAYRWGDAEREFQSVIKDFRVPNERVREMAADSYAYLGLVYLPTADDPQAPSRYRRAAEAYQSAIDVTHRDDHKAYFFSQRGFAFSRLGDAARAEDAYRRAAEIEPNPQKRIEYDQARQQASQG